jgi:ketosteroid isomerase-like protein
MQPNEELISRFYSCFQQRDYKGMNSCYSDDIVFFDPVFTLLEGDQVRAMWEMLCKNAKDFSLEFSDIKALDESYYSCNWVASYTFSKTGRRVVNRIKAYMKIADGKIIEHSDAFSVHRWSSQAFGWIGWLFGWNRFFQQKVKNEARKNLLKFMQQSGK